MRSTSPRIPGAAGTTSSSMPNKPGGLVRLSIDTPEAPAHHRTPRVSRGLTLRNMSRLPSDQVSSTALAVKM